jgi:hypothetical protein
LITGSREADQKEAIPWAKVRPLDRAIEDKKLLTEDKDFRRERYSGKEQGPEK